MQPLTARWDNDDTNTTLTVVKTGRPPIPLPPEVQEAIEHAYRDLGHSQARIGQDVGVSIPRVRRHLITRGLYNPRPSVRTPVRESQLAEAVQAYVDGEKVIEICQTYLVNPADLYREIRLRGVPLRTKSRTLEPYEHR